MAKLNDVDVILAEIAKVDNKIEPFEKRIGAEGICMEERLALLGLLTASRNEKAKLYEILLAQRQESIQSPACEYRTATDVVNVNAAIEIACSASCRAMLESFGQEFRELHGKIGLCDHQFPCGVSNTAIFHHFENVLE